MVKTFDSKCYELAVYFLEDRFDKVPVLIAENLARDIQQAVEDFFLDEDWGMTKRSEDK